MALHYCSLHQRLFSRRCQRWVCFSPATIHEIRGYYALLCSTHTDAAFLHVIELSCDYCAASLRTLAQSDAEDGVCGARDALDAKEAHTPWAWVGAACVKPYDGRKVQGQRCGSVPR
jgi:hypothetical protein